MSSSVFFKSMYEKVRKVVNACRDCLLANRTRPSRIGLSHKPPASVPGECIYVDVLAVEPVADPVTGHTITNCMLTVCDVTGYVVATPLIRLTAKESAIQLERNWYGLFGYARIVYSDAATNYSGALFQEMLQRHGIKHHTSPSRHYMGHGKVEQKCKQVATILRRMLENKQENWLDKLSDVVLEMNTSCTSVAGVSPYEAFLGRPPLTPLTTVLPDQAIVREMADTNFKRNDNEQAACKLILEKTQVAHENADKYYKHEVSCKPFATGQRL